MVFLAETSQPISSVRIYVRGCAVCQRSPCIGPHNVVRRSNNCTLKTVENSLFQALGQWGLSNAAGRRATNGDLVEK